MNFCRHNDVDGDNFTHIHFELVERMGLLDSNLYSSIGIVVLMSCFRTNFHVVHNSMYLRQTHYENMCTAQKSSTCVQK